MNQIYFYLHATIKSFTTLLELLVLVETGLMIHLMSTNQIIDHKEEEKKRTNTLLQRSARVNLKWIHTSNKLQSDSSESNHSLDATSAFIRHDLFIAAWRRRQRRRGWRWGRGRRRGVSSGGQTIEAAVWGPLSDASHAKTHHRHRCSHWSVSATESQDRRQALTLIGQWGFWRAGVV